MAAKFNVMEKVEIPEMRAVQSALRDLDLGKELKASHNEIAQGIVAAAVPRYGPRVSSKAKASVRAQSTAKEARIVAGGPSAPDWYGHEFGGGARPRTRQFRPHRGTEGYALFPTIRERKPETERIVYERVNDLFTRAFPR